MELNTCVGTHAYIYIYIANILGNLEEINLKKRNSIYGTLRAELF